MFDTTKPIYIDVREPFEFAEGHLEGALNIPAGSVGNTTQLGIPKDAQVVVYCRSGNRADMAKAQLESMGYSNVENGINQENIETHRGQ